MVSHLSPKDIAAASWEVKAASPKKQTMSKVLLDLQGKGVLLPDRFFLFGLLLSGSPGA